MDYASSVLPNPGSIHSEGVLVKQKLESARGEVARVLSVRPQEIIFTSGGTESNNLAIQGAVLAYKGPKIPHIIITNIEHPSVLDTCILLQKRGQAKISIISVEQSGIVDPKKIMKEMREETALVSVMYANNEIGTIMPITEIAKGLRHFKKNHPKSRVLFHTDAVQAVNYLPLKIEKLGIDLLTLSGSKIDGAGRVGVLYKKSSAVLGKVFGGGDQEGGLRPGTENVPEILKFAKAISVAEKIKEKETKRLTKLRDYFVKKLKGLPLIFNGDLENRLPNNINITIPKTPSDLLVIELSARGVMASAKSACKSGDGKASHVLRAINPKIKETDGSLRFSMGRDTTKEDINYIIKSLKDILKKLKRWYN